MSDLNSKSLHYNFNALIAALLVLLGLYQAGRRFAKRATSCAQATKRAVNQSLTPAKI